MRRKWRWAIGGLGVVLLAVALIVAAAGRDDLQELRPYVFLETYSYLTNDHPAIRAKLSGPPKPMMVRVLRLKGISEGQLQDILTRHLESMGGWSKPEISDGKVFSLKSERGPQVPGYGEQLRAVSAGSKQQPEFVVIERRTASWLTLKWVKFREWQRKRVGMQLR